MIRIVQLALLIAIVVPFGMAVRAGVHSLSDYWKDMAFAGLVGFMLCFVLWWWDKRIRQREGDDKRGP